MDPRNLKNLRIAVKLSSSGVAVIRLDGGHELRGVAEIDGVQYRDIGGTYNCGFYGTLQHEGRLVGFEVNLFGECQPAWSVLKKFKEVEFIENEGRLRLVWVAVRGEIVAGQEEWFQECALFYAEPDTYGVILDFPAKMSERLVVPRV